MRVAGRLIRRRLWTADILRQDDAPALLPSPPMSPLRHVGPLAIACWLVTATATEAGVVVHLDFTDFRLRLNQAAGASGSTPFDTGEAATIQSNVLTALGETYQSFDVTFQTTDGGATETLLLGAADLANSGFYGEAERIDYRNRIDGDAARVYTENFGFVLESSDLRADQIRELSGALAGTAAHELGHHLGLSHADSFGNRGFIYDGLSGPANAGGFQNDNLMAAGVTGLSEPQREGFRGLSPFSQLKLELAEGLTPGGPTPSLIETLSAHDTLAAAQTVALVGQAISGFDAANVVGAIAAFGERDVYRFTLPGPGFLSAATVTAGVNDAVNTVLTIVDSAGTTLGAVNDTRFIGSQFGTSGGSGSTDSTLYGLRIDASGDYFAVVEGFEGDTGDYELLVGFDADSAAVPEPGTCVLTLLAAGLGVAANRRRRRLAA